MTADFLSSWISLSEVGCKTVHKENLVYCLKQKHLVLMEAKPEGYQALAFAKQAWPQKLQNEDVFKPSTFNWPSLRQKSLGNYTA